MIVFLAATLTVAVFAIRCRRRRRSVDLFELHAVGSAPSEGTPIQTGAFFGSFDSFNFDATTVRSRESSIATISVESREVDVGPAGVVTSERVLDNPGRVLRLLPRRFGAHYSREGFLNHLENISVSYHVNHKLYYSITFKD